MNKLIRFLPLIVFIVLGVVLYRGLSLNPQDLPSALVGKPMPVFNLPALKNPERDLTEQALKGHISLVNVWGTWCPSCRYEHPYLVDLAKSDRFKLYGINWKDDRDLAKEWLVKLGDPYQFSIFDEFGKLAIDLGVYAAPETFVVDKQGIIRMRFAGPIDANVWREKFEPVIQQLEQEG